jgi:transcriptional regulator with XRE-family HTH domain
MYPNLKLTIFKRNLRQNRLAREVGIHAAALSKIIHGVLEPSQAQRSRLSEYLHAEESWLFEEYIGNGADLRAPQPETRERENGSS